MSEPIAPSPTSAIDGDFDALILAVQRCFAAAIADKAAAVKSFHAGIFPAGRVSSAARSADAGDVVNPPGGADGVGQQGLG